MRQAREPIPKKHNRLDRPWNAYQERDHQDPMKEFLNYTAWKALNLSDPEYLNPLDKQPLQMLQPVHQRPNHRQVRYKIFLNLNFQVFDPI